MMTTNSTSASARRSRPLRRALRILLILVGCLVLLGFAGWGWLQTGKGRDWILATLSARLEGIGGQQFTLEGLEGVIPTRVKLTALSISDDEGEWLVVRGLDLDWSLRALILDREVIVRTVSATEIAVHRLPKWRRSAAPGHPAESRTYAVPPMTLEVLVVPHIRLGEPLLGREAELSLSGACRVEDGGHHVEGSVDIRDRTREDARIVAGLDYTHPRHGFGVDLELTAPSGSFFAHLLRMDAAGDLVARVQGGGPLDDWKGRIQMQASQWGDVRSDLELGWTSEPWARATGQVEVTAEQLTRFPTQADFTVFAQQAPDQRWKIQPALQVDAVDGELHGDLLFDPATLLAEGSATVSVLGLREVTAPLGYAVDGDVNLILNLDRQDNHQVVRADLTAIGLSSAHASLETVHARVSIPDAWTPQSVDVDVVVGKGRPTNLAWAALPVEFADPPDGDVDGRVSLRGSLSDPIVQATINLNPAGEPPVPGLTARGRFENGNLTAEVLTRDSPIGTLEFHLNSPLAFSLYPFRLARSDPPALQARLKAALKVSGVSSWSQHLPDFGPLDTLTLDAAIDQLSQDEFVFNPLAVAMSCSAMDPDAEQTPGPGWQRPMSLETTGTLTVGSERQSLAVEKLEVMYGDHSAVATAPFDLSRQVDRWTLRPLHVDIAGAELRLAGHYAPDSVDLLASVTNLPLDVLPIQSTNLPNGQIHARVALGGTPDQPVIHGAVGISPIMTTGFQELGVPAIGFAAEASIQEGRLVATVRAKDNLIGALDAELSMPLTLSLQPFRFARPEGDLLETQLHADLDLSFLDWLPFMNGQHLQGQVTADLAYQGPQEDFALKGTAQLRDGAYEHYRAGTTLRGITADFRTRDKDLVLEHFDGVDGSGGTLAATGGISLRPEEHFPFSVHLTANQATLVRQDHLTATVSAGVDISGDFRRVAITGNVSVVSGEFNINRLPPSPPPILDIVEIGRVDEPEPATVESTEASPPAKRLRGDLRLSLDAPFFVRGAGLDSAWRGSVNLVSDGGPWRLEGTFAPRRGTYEFFGRKFTLVNSAIYLKGDYPVTPVLDITAEYQRPEIRTRLRITGPLNDPVVDLESEPDYPRDEIVARTMFGTSATGLTPLQTAQLGLAVASTARRSESTFDFMGRTRNRFRVDELGFREDAQDSNQVELVAGRFVSDRLFVEYTKRMGGDRGGGVRAEYEINRHLSFETNAGAQMRPGVRLNIKFDY